MTIDVLIHLVRRSDHCPVVRYAIGSNALRLELKQDFELQYPMDGIANMPIADELTLERLFTDYQDAIDEEMSKEVLRDIDNIIGFDGKYAIWLVIES